MVKDGGRDILGKWEDDDEYWKQSASEIDFTGISEYEVCVDQITSVLFYYVCLAFSHSILLCSSSFWVAGTISVNDLSLLGRRERNICCFRSAI